MPETPKRVSTALDDDLVEGEDLLEDPAIGHPVQAVTEGEGFGHFEPAVPAPVKRVPNAHRGADREREHLAVLYGLNGVVRVPGFRVPGFRHARFSTSQTEFLRDGSHQFAVGDPASRLGAAPGGMATQHKGGPGEPAFVRWLHDRTAHRRARNPPSCVGGDESGYRVAVPLKVTDDRPFVHRASS
jgi:hypothetical protein